MKKLTFCRNSICQPANSGFGVAVSSADQGSIFTWGQHKVSGCHDPIWSRLIEGIKTDQKSDSDSITVKNILSYFKNKYTYFIKDLVSVFFGVNRFISNVSKSTLGIQKSIKRFTNLKSKTHKIPIIIKLGSNFFLFLQSCKGSIENSHTSFTRVLLMATSVVVK